MHHHPRFIFGLGIWARAVLGQTATFEMRYQQGQFDVETIFKPSITGDTATTCTATSSSAIITTTVPIWSCTACPTGFNAVLVSPVSLRGLPGVPSPPPGYQPLGVGPDMIATRLSLPTSAGVASETYKYINSTSVSTHSGNRGSSPTAVNTEPSRSTGSFSAITIPMKSSSGPNSTSLVGSGTEGSRPSSAPAFTGTGSIALGTGENSPSTAITIGTSHSLSPGQTSQGQKSDVGSGAPTSLSNSKPESTGNKTVAVPIVTTIEGQPMVSGGDISSPILITATKSIDLRGSEASSSGIMIQSKVRSVVPEVQDLIKHPSKEKADDTIKAIDGILPTVMDLIGKLNDGSDTNQKSCSVSTNSISDLFNAAICLADDLKKVTDDINRSAEDDFKNLEDVTDTLQAIQDLEGPLDESNDKGPGTSSPKSQSEANTESQSQSSQSTSSCTHTTTASDCQITCPSPSASDATVETQSCSTTCSSTQSGCSVTGSTSTTYAAEACTLPTGSMAEPTGPFQTAWWDYGLSCAGKCGGFIAGPSTSIVEATSTNYSPSQTSNNSKNASSRPPSTLRTSSKVPPPSSTSPSSTQPPSTQPSSTSPVPFSPTAGPIQCIPKPEKIKCWKDVHKNLVEETANQFWTQLGDDATFTAQTLNRTQCLRKGGESGKGVTYMMNIGWIPKCTLTKSQKADHPIPGNDKVSYTDLLKEPYYKCTGNDGLGGWQDVGCLRYGFYPNNAGTFTDGCDAEKYFDGMKYCG